MSAIAKELCFIIPGLQGPYVLFFSVKVLGGIEGDVSGTVKRLGPFSVRSRSFLWRKAVHSLWQWPLNCSRR